LRTVTMQSYLRYFLLIVFLAILAGCSDKSPKKPSEIENPHKNQASEVNIKVSEETLQLFNLIDQDNLELLKQKLSQSINLESRNASGDTLLIYAASKAKTKVINMLLDAGATVNVYGGQGDTALLRAAAGGSVETVKILIDARADVNAKGKKEYLGASPLFLASSVGSVEIVELLLKNGADINLGNNKGVTPLMDAAYGSQDMVRLLLKHGAKINIRDENGDNAIKIARREEQKEIYKILKQAKKENRKKKQARKSK